MEIKTLNKNEEKTTIEVVFKSGKKVKINIDEKKGFNWIQMFFNSPVVPNSQTFGKVAKRLYTKRKEFAVAFHIRDKNIQVI